MKSLILFLVFILADVCNIKACSCDTMKFEKAIQWADEIFIGRIISMEEVDSDVKENLINTSLWKTTFEVTKKWKGSSNKYIDIYQNHSMSCDFNFQFPSNDYIIYAQKNVEDFTTIDKLLNKQTFYTYLCARNANSSTYENFYKKGFDDRPKLDSKFPNKIYLYDNVKYHLIIFGISALLFIILIGFLIKKYLA